MNYSSVFTALLISTTAIKAETIKKPNIVIILADDLGWSDLGIAGSDYYETPHIDTLAKESMRFNSAYACQNSAPTRASLMTGLYTPRHGIFTVSPPDRGDATKRKLISAPNTDDLSNSFTTIAEALSDNGYQCGHFGKWHLGSDHDESKTGPLSQGFHYNIAGDRAGTPYSYFSPYKNNQGKFHIGLEAAKQGEYLTDRLTTEAIEWMKCSTNKPFFLYMAHHAVHNPLVAPKELIEKYKNKPKGLVHNNPIYAAMIESLDYNTGRLLKAIKELGIEENTLVIFLSDNGGVATITSNYPLRGGKGMPYEGGNRIPMFIKWPNKVANGITCSIPVHVIDLFPTIMEITNDRKKRELDGISIVPLLVGEENKFRHRELYSHFPAYLEGPNNGFRATPNSSIIFNGWKLIYSFESGKSELYHLPSDIGEIDNLAEKEIKQRKRLEKKLFKWLESTAAPIPSKANPMYRNN